MKHNLSNVILFCLVLCISVKLMAQNTLPEVTRIEILPNNPTLDDDLTLDYDYYDADGDPEDVSQRTIYWKRNGVYQQTYRHQLTLPASATGDNELWEVQLRVHDGTDRSIMYTTSVSFGTPIPNTRPEVRNMEIQPNNPIISDDLNLTYTYYDAEGNPEDVSKRRVYWQRNGEWSYAHENLLAVPASDTRDGEIWQCVIYVHDGKDVSSAYWADPVTIGNTTPTFELTMAVAPERSGTTEPEPGVHTYYEGTVVNIIATPLNEYQFVNWTGNVADPNDPATTITMSADQLVTANFEESGEVISTPNTPDGPSYSYKMLNTKITTDGSTSNLNHEVEYQFDYGDGRISGWGESRRYHRFRKTGILKLRARARCQTHTSVISEWSESTEITIWPCTLNVTITPPEAGHINRVPNSPEYDYGQEVTLTAVASNGIYVFDHWSGDISGTNNPEQLTMKGGHDVTAHFSPTVIMPPHLENCYPPLGASEIPKNASIHLSVKDKAVGIALNSLQILVNGTEIVNNGVDATGGNVFIESENKNYKIKYVPLVEFPEKSAVTVRVKCNNLAGVGCDSSYTFNIGTSNISITKIDTISIMGGSVKDTTTHVEITIPAGALEESTEIIIALVDMLPALPDSAKGIGLGYYFGPAGLKFNNPVTLSIPYSQSDLNEAGVDDPMKLSIYYFSTTKGNWSILNNTGVDTTAGLIFCQIDEFCYLTFGKKAATGVSGQHISSITPSNFGLMQNYPNPFNPETMIQYQLPKTSYIKLEVFNILGERIRTLIDAKQSAGSYQIIWDGKNDAGTVLTSGIYFYVLRMGNIVKFKKAIFMK